MNAADFARRLDNLIRLGTIAQIDHDRARCRVRSGELLTDWLPFFSRRAGETRTWCPPTPGEQVAVFCPCGEPAAGFVLTGLYSDHNAAPSTDKEVHMTEWPDGSTETYNHEMHTYELVIPLDGTLTLECAGSSIVMDKDGIRLRGKRIDLN